MRLRHNNGMRPRHRLAFAGGTILGLVTMLPPVAGLSGRLLLVHTARQMILLAVAGPLLAYATASIVKGRARVLPLAGITAFNAAVLLTQLPVILRATSSTFALDLCLQLAFLGASLLFWLPVMACAGLSRIGKIGYLLVAGVPPTIPGVVLAFSRHPLYLGYQLGDQQLAGLLLFATAKFTLIGGTFFILWRLLSAEAEPGDDDDRGVPIPETPPAAPAWLRRLDEVLPEEPAPARPRALSRPG